MAAVTRSGSRPVATTALPAANAALAMSVPRPRPAPVTSQTFLFLEFLPFRPLEYSWSMTCSVGCLPPACLRPQFGRAVAVVIRVQGHAGRYQFVDAVQDLGVQR